MKAPQMPGRLLAAAAAVIALTNAVALGGAAYNRAGAQDSRLRLSYRELDQPFRDDAPENSGLTLRLRWLTERREQDETYVCRYAYCGSNEPAWLDEAKMVELGFDLARLKRKLSQRQQYFLAGELPRQVLLVLELDGPTYQRVLAQARSRADQAAANASAKPGDATAQKQAKAAAEELEETAHRQSRLFVVDAGLDRASLRRQYPDTARYAIVCGRISPEQIRPDKAPRIVGYVSGVDAQEVNVPLRFRSMLAQILVGSARPYSVSVAFGRRLEPWITEVSATAAGP